MLSRKIEKDIINWLENENKALLIDGARQVGKTYIIRKVLNEKNFSYNEFNLLETPEIVELLKTTHSVDELITNLSLFAENPFEKGTLFLFCGQRCDRMKGLLWQGTGFLLLYKRFESGGLSWPRNSEEAAELTEEQFRYLMLGLNPLNPFHTLSSFICILQEFITAPEIHGIPRAS